MDEETKVVKPFPPSERGWPGVTRRGLLPGEEVVEVYRQPERREVVETYIRPLPGRPAAAPPPGRKWRKKKTGLWIFLACCAAVSLLAVGARLLEDISPSDRGDIFEYYYERPGDSGEKRAITMDTYPVGQGAALVVERDHGSALPAQEIYRQVNPAVVTVIAQLADGASLGTGVIFRPDGYILTNYHVVEGGKSCTVALDTGRTYEALYVAGDEENDLAVLKVDLMELPFAEFGDSDLLTVGDKVYAIGNPLGYELRGTLTDGIVSAINRDVQVDGRTMNLIQTNAALNSGNSGGPLVNEYGQVVGINTIKMISRYSNIEGLGFAIPSASIQYLVNDLLAWGRVQPEPVLGVSVSQAGTQVAEGLMGVEVLQVTPDSAAEAAGVQEGDFIVFAAGVDVTTSRDLLRARRQFHVGDEMPLTLWRHGELIEVTLHLLHAEE